MHSILVVCMGVASNGPGESALRTSAMWSSRLSTAVVRDAPHISQFSSEGWFWYVQRGQDNMPPAFEVDVVAPCLLSFGGGAGALFEIAAIAAFTTCI